MDKAAAEERLATLRTLEDSIRKERKGIYQASLDAPEGEKLCSDYMARSMVNLPYSQITYPIEVIGIHHSDVPVLYPAKTQKWVAVRPVDPELEGKTYLGVLLGNMAQGCGAWFKNGVLEIEPMSHNPAIYCPDLHRVIMGSGSWWHELESPKDLQEITDLDINSTWYVKALKDLEK